MFDGISSIDKETADILKEELARQEYCLEMIPSENFVSLPVLEALGSIMTNKYSEGYPGARYYAGNENIDRVENLARKRAKELFKVEHVNVQPYSGSPANFAVYMSVCKPGETIMGQNLTDGGHLTHGWKTSLTGQIFKSVPYHVKPDGYIDIEEARKLARENKPKLIWVGATAYTRSLPFAEFSDIAEECGAYLAADISHISGLVVAGAHESPAEYAHIITTTTHKTLRGPRGAMIMVTKKGVEKDPDLPDKIDRTIFPGMQGGPHDHVTAAIAIALKEASSKEFRDYAFKVVSNAKALAESLKSNGIDLVTGGTDNHMVLIDLTKHGKGLGLFAQDALDKAGITVNKNTIPNDPSSPFYPSGIRLGTPALTTRGMKEKEMSEIAGMIANVIGQITRYHMPDEKQERQQLIKKFREEIASNEEIKKIRAEVREICERFPLYPSFISGVS